MAGQTYNNSNSKLEDTGATALTSGPFSITVEFLANSAGGGGFGRILNADDAGGGLTNGFFLAHNSSANLLQFTYLFDLGQNGWSIAASDGALHVLGLSYDPSASANDPTTRIDFAAVTPTNTGRPGNTAVAPAAGYCIGNRNDSSRSWDGMLRNLQFHPGILSTANLDKAGRFPGSVRTEGAFWWPMENASYTEKWTVSSGVWVRATDPTAANLASSTVAGTKTLVVPRSGRGTVLGLLKRQRLVA